VAAVVLSAAADHAPAGAPLRRLTEGINVETVQNHVSNGLLIVGAADRAHAVALARDGRACLVLQRRWALAPVTPANREALSVA